MARRSGRSRQRMGRPRSRRGILHSYRRRRELQLQLRTVGLDPWTRWSGMGMALVSTFCQQTPPALLLPLLPASSGTLFQ
eukprot:12910566-Prorocentrum_lima.AAC.1